MKKQLFYLALAGLTLATSCKKDEEKKPVEPSKFIELTGNLETQTLDPSKKYLLKGTVFIQDGKTLTVPAGTIVMGEKRTKGTLVVNIGGKLIAKGEPNKPVIFTSNQETFERDKGDWGGIIMLGRANCNQNRPAIEGVTPEVVFGSFQNDAFDNESSGELTYVRIEYAGIALSPNNETNSLTMGGVGRGTKIEYVQVSYGGDDGFEWFGGTVDAKYLISHGTWDDDFDCDFGWSGNVQFGLAVRDPFAADQSGSNAFECDNDANGNAIAPYTSGVFSNITVLGPIVNPRASRGNQASGNYQHAFHLRRRTAVSVFNSVITGFPVGFRLDGLTTEEQYTSNNRGRVAHNILVQANGGSSTAAAVITPYAAGSNNTVASVQAYWEANNLLFGDTTSSTSASGKNIAKAFVDAGVNTALIMGVDNDFRNYPNNPNFATFSGVTQSGAIFSNEAKLPASFFMQTSYRGAFGATDWTDGWAAFFPQGIEY